MKFNSEQIAEINRIYDSGLKITEVAIKYNTSFGSIQPIIINPRKQGSYKRQNIKITQVMKDSINVLYFKQERSVKHIAELLKISLPSVRTHLKYGAE